MHQGTTYLPGATWVWKNWAPQRVKFFTWLALRQRLWSAETRRRHWTRRPWYLLLCDQESETVDHLLVNCSFANLSLSQIWVCGGRGPCALDDAFACFFLNERALCTISINIEGEKTGRKSWEASYTEETTENEKRKKKAVQIVKGSCGRTTWIIPAQVRRLSLFRLKCADYHYIDDMISTHFKWNNPMVCRPTFRWNHRIPDRLSIPCTKVSLEIQSPSYFYNIGTSSYYKPGSDRVLQI
jgi:hypothetical protein